MPRSPVPLRPLHSRAGKQAGGEPGGSPAPALGIRAPEWPARRLRPSSPAGQAPVLRCPPRPCRPPVRPSPARRAPPHAHLAWTAAARAVARGHAPGAHPACRVPARWPLPQPQAPRSALRKGGEPTGRRHGRGRSWGPPAGRAGGGERGGENCSARLPPEMHRQVQRPQLCRGLSAPRVNGLITGLRTTSGALASGEGRVGGGPPRGYVIDRPAVTRANSLGGCPTLSGNSGACPRPRRAVEGQCSQKELSPAGSKSELWRRHPRAP